MPWTKPQYSAGRINRAGDLIIGNTECGPDDLDEALAVIGNWRACHAYPLLAARMTLTARAKSVDKRAIIAQRLKRLWSIQIKLLRNENMALSQVQDIGGCRAVVGSVMQVDKLVKLYDDWTGARPLVGAEFVKKYDYIRVPKKDGYRSVHLIYKYRSASKAQADWNGLRIEIQIRSRLQHAWATAVETVDTFTRQTIKVGGGKEGWRRFFLLMSTAIAHNENRPICEGCPSTKDELRTELKQLARELNVKSVLRGWSRAMKRLPSRTMKNAAVYLLYLDTTEGAERIKITGFPTAKDAKASETYLSTEKAIKDEPHLNAVLVSARSVQALNSAFPNYFADTRVFLKAVDGALSASSAA